MKNMLTENPERCSGRTTRLADQYIQELFVKGEVTVRDHFDNMRGHIYLFERIKKRLEIEHRFVKLEFKRSSLSIRIADEFRHLVGRTGM